MTIRTYRYPSDLEKQNKQKNSSKETRLSKALKKISISRTAKEVTKDMVNKTREELFSRGIECNKEQAQKLLEIYYHFNLKPDNNGEDVIYYAHNIKTDNEEEIAFWLEQDNKLYIQDKKVYNKILPEVSRIIGK